MSNSPKPGSFEGFLRWLAESRPTTGADSTPPSSDVLAAANLAWRETAVPQRGATGGVRTACRAGVLPRGPGADGCR